MTAPIVNRYPRTAVRRIATAEDVFFIYHVLLGRDAENEAIVQDQAGRPLDETCAGFVASEEFGLMAADELRI